VGVAEEHNVRRCLSGGGHGALIPPLYLPEMPVRHQDAAAAKFQQTDRRLACPSVTIPGNGYDGQFRAGGSQGGGILQQITQMKHHVG